MFDVSATGLSLTIKASVTFPQGFTFTEFADDADGWDAPAIDIATTAMNLNGDLVVFSSPVPLVRTVNAIPGSPGQRNLAIIYEANRVAKGKRSARDIITVVANYPDGSTETLSRGKMTNGMPGKSVAPAGRIKTNAYTFAFEGLASTAATEDFSA
jgi:hypothetical protein